MLTLPYKPSIAFLPFQNMNGDIEQDYFFDGIIEDVIAHLSKIPGTFRHRAEVFVPISRHGDGRAQDCCGLGRK